MKDFLTFVDDETYAAEFSRIICSERLTVPQIEGYKIPVIGQVLSDFLGYEKALRLKKFFGTETCQESSLLGTKLLKAGNILERYGLSIGSNKGLEIFQERHDIPMESYILSKLFYRIYRNNDRVLDKEEIMPSKWIAVPEPFLVDTYRLLPDNCKSRFRLLKSEL